MFASTMLWLWLPLFGQVVSGAEQAAFPLRPVQIPAADGPSLYGGPTPTAAMPQPPASNRSAFGDQYQPAQPAEVGGPAYGGSFSSRYRESAAADVAGGNIGDFNQGVLPRSGSGDRSAFQQVDAAGERAHSMDEMDRAEFRRTGAEQPLAPLQAVEPKPAAAIIARALQTVEGDRFDGQPVALRVALARVVGSDGQQRTVEAYWRLTVAVCEFDFATAENEWLTQLPAPPTAHQQARLAAVLASSDARWEKAKLAVIGGQHDLAEAGLMPAGELPFPADAPHVGNYATHFKTLHERGAAPQHLQRIHHTLPHIRSLIDSQANAILTAEQAVDNLQQAYESGQVDLDTVLQTHRDLIGQRREFLAAVLQYNLDIANYALTVAGSRGGADRIVGMLIETRPADAAVLAGPNERPSIQRVSNDQPLSAEPPSTFQR